MALPLVAPNLLSRIQPHIYAPNLKHLKEIFASMDRQYQEAADYYGFNCTGCQDNCCLTRFYHHTLLEYLYILEGFHTLDQKRQVQVKNKAAEVCRRTALADRQNQPVRLMCPLNFDGMCLLYAYRPMICRLFGIPHELQQPGQAVVRHSGCQVFAERCAQKDYFTFNRTPFFIEMAQLEMELKQTLGIAQKIKVTVAEMIDSFHS